jgi:phage-related protein
MEGRRSRSSGNRCRSSGRYLSRVYTVRFKKAIYVLHAFQKKSKSGIATPRIEREMIAARLKKAEQHYKEHYD